MRLGRIASLTDTGRKRRRNEDAYVVRPPLFAVADGMGGAQAGEIASRLATEAVREDEGRGGGQERVAALIQAANQRVFERSNVDAAASGMGTTITVALVEDELISIGHVGDSRAYLVRGGKLEQLTEDHSLVGELLRSGKLSPEEAETHPQRSVITRALGTDADVDVDTFSLQPRPGDLFLLCSDGLTSMVGDEEILRTVEESRDDLERAARELVGLANRGGGEDNITVVFFEIADETVAQTAVLDVRAPETEAKDADEEDEEDTLDELDAVPAVAGPEAEEPSRSRRLLRWLGLALLVVALALAVLAVWSYAS
jgi:PPM family protein phosphatase